MLIDHFISGLLLGYGAAVPIGAVNIEITRRNLLFGTRHGIATGLGACSADLVYLVLLSLGFLVIASQAQVLNTLSILGSLVLFWFAIQAIRAPVKSANESEKSLSNTESPSTLPGAKSHHRNWRDGFFMTLLNPYTVLFWLSVSSQVVALSDTYQFGLWVTGFGLLLGTSSWVLFLNGVLHHTRHMFGPRAMRALNIVGAVILSCFAFFGIYRGLSGFLSGV